MVNMGGRDIDGFKKPGHKMEAILGGAEKLPVLGNLVRDLLASDDTVKEIITNLL